MLLRSLCFVAFFLSFGLQAQDISLSFNVGLGEYTGPSELKQFDSLQYTMDMSALTTTESRPPEFQGGADNLYAFLAANFRYSPKIINENLSGVITLNFDVEVDGAISNFTVVSAQTSHNVHGSCYFLRDQMPRWYPGIENGTLTSSTVELHIKYAANSYGKPTATRKDFYDFISTYLKYPLEAAESGVMGTVVVQFEMNAATGKVEEVVPIQDPSGMFYEQIKIVLESAPVFEDDETRGHEKFLLPITYTFHTNPISIVPELEDMGYMLHEVLVYADVTDAQPPPDSRGISFEDATKVNEDGTITLHYSPDYILVRPECASIFRIATFDEELNFFDGEFKDYYVDSTLAVEGSYFNTALHGSLVTYYPNGRVKAKGAFANNMKTGFWEYYYPNGAIKQIFEFTPEVILIHDYWNEEGEHLVNDGRGEYSGISEERVPSVVRGEVRNYRQQGKWKLLSGGRRLNNIEYYGDGKLIKGKDSPYSYAETYYTNAHCSPDFKAPFREAEKFIMQNCFLTYYVDFEFSNPIIPDGCLDIEGVRPYLIWPLTFGDKLSIDLVFNKSGKIVYSIPKSDTGSEDRIVAVLEKMNKDRTEACDNAINERTYSNIQIEVKEWLGNEEFKPEF